jgi:hypothetical protein
VNTAGGYFLLPERLLPLERDEPDFFLLEPELDDFDFDLAAGFFAAERFVVVFEPDEREALLAGAAVGGGGVAAGALAEAERVRPPATATRG